MPATAELHYFQTTEPPERQMGGARFVACGSLLLLCAAASAFACALLVRVALPYASSREMTQIIWTASLTALTALVLGTLGVGALRRRRWSRPLILGVCWPWLTCGLIVGGAVAIMTIRQMLRWGFGPTDVRELMMMAGSFGTLGTVGVVIPLTSIAIVRPRRVQQALNDRDLKSRWTDTWSIHDMISLMATIGLTLALITVSLNVVDSLWPANYPVRWFTLVAAAATAGVGSMLLALRYSGGWWFTVIAAGTALGVVVVGSQSGFGSRMEFEDILFTLMLAGPLVTLILFQLRHFPHWSSGRLPTVGRPPTAALSADPLDAEPLSATSE